LRRPSSPHGPTWLRLWPTSVYPLPRCYVPLVIVVLRVACRWAPYVAAVASPQLLRAEALTLSPRGRTTREGWAVRLWWAGCYTTPPPPLRYSVVPEVALTAPSLVPPIRSLADDPMLLEVGLRAAPRGVSTRPVPLTTVFDRIRSPPPPSSTRGQVAPLPPQVTHTLIPSAWYSTLPPLGAESPSVTRPSGRSPPGATVMLAASVEPPRPDLASLVADFCVPSPPLLCAPRRHRAKGGLPMGTLRHSSRIAAASKGRGPNPVTAGQNLLMRKLGVVRQHEAPDAVSFQWNI
jgi:hypothetical protein